MRVGIMVYGLARGGRSRILCQLANGLAARGHDVRVVMLKGQPVAYPLQVPVERVTQLADAQLGNFDLAIPASFGLVPTALRAGARTTVRFCTDFEPDLVYDRQSALEVYQMPLPTIAVSEPLAEQITQLSGQKTYVAQPGVDAAVFRPDPVQRAPGGKRLAYVYRPEALGYGYKRNGDFWKATQQIKYHEPDLQVSVLVPDGLTPDTMAPHEVVNAANDAELAAFYRRANALVVASASEGYALPALEAMACGTPVVLTDSGGVRDYATPGVNCFMGLPGDVSMLRDLILAALRRPDMSDPFAMAGLKTARDRTWERFVGQAEAALQEISGVGSWGQHLG